MTKDQILEEYRKLKLEEELNRELEKRTSKYDTIKITYERYNHSYYTIQVDKKRFREFIKREIDEITKGNKNEIIKNS